MAEIERYYTPPPSPDESEQFYDAPDSSLDQQFGSNEDEERDRKAVLLYQAALKGDWSAAMGVLDDHEPPVLPVIYPITRQKETVLHIAAAAKRTDFVKELVARMTPSDLQIRNKKKNTALCFAIASGIVAIAKEMVNRNNELPLIRVGEDPSVTPLYLAALQGRSEMVSYLYSVTPLQHLTPRDRVDILVACISSDLYDIALKILKKHPELATMENSDKKIALQELAKKPYAIGRKSQLSFWERCLNSWPFRGIYSKALMRTIGHQLVDLVWENVRRLPQREFRKLVRLNSSFLFDAARTGNVEFLIILIRSYPDLIWRLDQNKHSIFHIAIKCRQENVFNLIYELGAIKDIIALYTDTRSNNMLHLAGEIAPDDTPNRLNVVSGAALNMQRELLWFKEIETIVQPSYKKKVNSDSQNPRELFTMQHEDLRKEGEKWMKDTANYGMLVAALIATVVFAAAFALPGGNNQELGIPILLRSNWFLVFFISDAIALLSSSTSILIFLSVLTSRYAENDFLHSLPARMLLGLATLFISIASMVVAFSATCFLVYDAGIASVPIIIISLACVPVTLFFILHYRLWADIFQSTYGSRFLFRPHERRLF